MILPGRDADTPIMSMHERRLVIYVYFGHPNGHASSEASRRAFARFGFDMRALALSDPGIVRTVETLLRDRSGEIFCFVSSSYYGTVLRNGDKLLHQMTGIPLAILLHDHPLYFLAQQTPALNDTITLVTGDDLPDFISKYYPIRTTVISRPAGPPVSARTEPNYEQFLSRENALLCPMNLHVSGETLDQVWLHIKELPQRRRDFSIAHLEATLTDWRTPLHSVAERLPESLLSLEERRAALADQTLVMNFVKLWRRNAMVRALIELPIVVSSEYVPADLAARYPKKFRLLGRNQTIPLYRRYRFTVNANPTVNILHDRVVEAVAAGSVCITDPTPLLASLFRDGIEAIWFDYERKGMADLVAGYLDDPESSYRLSVAADAALLANEDAVIGGYRRLIQLVEAYWQARAA